MPKTKKIRLGVYFSLGCTGGWGGRIKHNDNDWKFQKYKGTNSDYDMLSESVNTDQDEKKGDVLKGNRIINLNNLITYVDVFFGVQRVCDNLPQTKKPRLVADFSLDHTGGWGGRIKQNCD